MTTGPLPFADLERAFEAIAAAIDDVGAEKDRLFLAKLALALSHRLGDLDAITDAIAEAKSDLEG